MAVAALIVALGMQSAQLQPQPTLPSEAGKSLTAYFSCLFDPLAGRMATDLPAARKKREKIVKRLLTQCASLRATAREEALQDAVSNTDKAEAERALLAVEALLRLVVVEREKAIAADEAFCRSRGEKPGC